MTRILRSHRIPGGRGNPLVGIFTWWGATKSFIYRREEMVSLPSDHENGRENQQQKGRRRKKKKGITVEQTSGRSGDILIIHRTLLLVTFWTTRRESAVLLTHY